MSLLLLIDGYNIVAPVAPPGRGASKDWLQQERSRLIGRLTDHLDPSVAARTCVVFDAANPPRDRPHQFESRGMTIRFAVGYPEADDLLEELISGHSSPKRLAVVSGDHRVQHAARSRGCTPFDATDWFDRLLDGETLLAPRPGSRGPTRLRSDGRSAGQGRGDTAKDDVPTQKHDAVSEEEVDRWLRDFGFDEK